MGRCYGKARRTERSEMPRGTARYHMLATDFESNTDLGLGSYFTQEWGLTILQSHVLSYSVPSVELVRLGDGCVHT